jgi:hypothetical protein
MHLSRRAAFVRAKRLIPKISNSCRERVRLSESPHSFGQSLRYLPLRAGSRAMTQAISASTFARWDQDRMSVMAISTEDLAVAANAAVPRIPLDQVKKCMAAGDALIVDLCDANEVCLAATLPWSARRRRTSVTRTSKTSTVARMPQKSELKSNRSE